MSISSDEVNFLIYRYLLENGFAHSAFTFSHESLVTRSTISQSDVPPGALITFLQKGLEYVGIEEHIAEDGTVKDFDANYSLLSPFIVQAVGTKEEKKIEKSKSQLAAENKAKEQATNGSGGKMDVASNDDKAQSTNSFAVAKHDQQVRSVTLQGHQGEVFVCLWNPVRQQLASGSADGTCRVWGLSDASQARDIEDGMEIPVEATVMPHAQYLGERNKDVTSLNWSPDGSRLATGCYDGVARIWNEHGELLHDLHEHIGPVYSIQWSKDGNYLVSGSYDRRAVVWDAKSGKVCHIFTVHAAPVLDVAWKDSSVFASSSSDRKIHVCAIVNTTSPDSPIDPTKALCTFEGHTDEVNCITWSPGGNYLASCSDDTTAKVWSEADGLKFDLKGHTKEIYTIRWTPTGPGSKQTDKPLRLCSASFDGTVKVWSVEDGSIVLNLSRHGQPVYTLAPNPSGSTLAAGSLGGYVTLWSVEDGAMINEVRGMGDTFDVCWSADGHMLSSCFSSGTINIMLVD